MGSGRTDDLVGAPGNYRQIMGGGYGTSSIRQIECAALLDAGFYCDKSVAVGEGTIAGKVEWEVELGKDQCAAVGRSTNLLSGLPRGEKLDPVVRRPVEV